jgi:hypothetical protein
VYIHYLSRAFYPLLIQLLHNFAMNSDYFLAIEIIGTEVAITTILLFGAWRALRAAGRPPTDVWSVVLTLGALLFGWLGAALYLGWLGIFRSAVDQPFPYIALAIGVPILIGALLIFGSRRVWGIVDAVPQSWLVGFQFYRVVGVTFLILYAGGRLPGIFALPAGYGDTFVGLTALLVAAGYARYSSKCDPFVALWNWLGLADLVVAIATGFLSAPSRFQIFSLQAPNFLIGSFPLVMIPIYAVPLSIVLHLASLTKLRQGNAHRRERFGHSELTDPGTV